jgi:parvulin-like peptidyl-prolyl isomerase
MAEMRKEEDEKLSSAADYLLARLWMEDLAKRGVVAVGDEEVRRYHGEHPGEVLARHILLASPGEAESALRALRSGARFASLAKTRSLDSETAPEGGLLRPALYGEILPEFDVLFRMRNGELAGPLRSKLGYHVVLKEGERRVSLESAAPRIRNILEKQKLDRRLQSLEASLRVEVIDAAFK